MPPVTLEEGGGREIMGDSGVPAGGDVRFSILPCLCGQCDWTHLPLGNPGAAGGRPGQAQAGSQPLALLPSPPSSSAALSSVCLFMYFLVALRSAFTFRAGLRAPRGQTSGLVGCVFPGPGPEERGPPEPPTPKSACGGGRGRVL